MTATTTISGFAALAIVHSRHAERIAAATEAMTAGAVVVIDVDHTTDLGAFFTGVHVGDRVAVCDFHQSGSGHVSRAVSVLSHAAASLSVNGGHTLTPVDPDSLSQEEAAAAQGFAARAADDQMERALRSATGGLGAPAGDDAAIAALHRAKALRDLAFAYGVLAEWIHGLAIGDGYYVGTLRRAKTA